MAPVTLLPRAAQIVPHFWRLDARRQHSAFGLAPVSFQDLVAYKELTGVSLSPWEVKMIFLLDDQNLYWFANRQAASAQ